MTQKICTLPEVAGKSALDVCYKEPGERIVCKWFWGCQVSRWWLSEV